MHIGTHETLLLNPENQQQARMPRQRLGASILCCSLIFGGSACGLVEGSGCNADLRINVAPIAQSLRIGESFTPTAHALGCGGREDLQQTWTWRSGDSTVVNTNVLTGRSIAMKAGSTNVLADGVPYPAARVVIPVTVLP